MTTSWLLLIGLALAALWGSPAPASAVTPAAVTARSQALGVPFIENRGQTDARVALYAHTFGGTVLVTRSGEIVYVLATAKAGETDARQTLALREVVVGRKASHVRGEGQAVTRVSDFAGQDRSKWRSGLPTFDAVSLGEVYPGIALRLKARGDNVEKLFHVSPGARPGAIRLRIEGARGLRVDERGELEVATALGPVRFTRPVAFQEIGGRRLDVPVRYALHGGGTYGFAVGAHDATHTLVIDPLLASTFVGGSRQDRAYAVALERVALVYPAAVFIAGWTTSKRLPGARFGTVYDSARAGGEDAFVAKLDGDLSQVLAATFLGGRDVEEAWGLSLDVDGNVYVAGFTNSHDFPTTAGAASRVYGGGRTDAFVAKLDNGLQTLLASTLLGGGQEDRAQAVALGQQGVFVTGFTRSRDFPSTIRPCCAVHDWQARQSDVFVTRLGQEHLDLLASARIGGVADDRGQAIAVGGTDRGFLTGDEMVVITGCAGRPNGQATADAYFPTTTDAYRQTQSNDQQDAFVTVLSWDLVHFHGSTLLGGAAGGVSTQGTCGRAVAIDSRNNVFVAGVTLSADFETTPGAYDEGHNDRIVKGNAVCGAWNQRGPEGRGDAFVARLGSGAYEEVATLGASTLLGGCGADVAHALVLQVPTDPSNESSGNVYVAGQTYSADFPTTPGAYDQTHGGRADAFVAKLDYALQELRAATLLGGRAFDAAVGLARDGSGNVYVAGYTYSDDFPTMPGAADEELSGGTDAFVSKLDGSLAAIGIDLD